LRWKTVQDEKGKVDSSIPEQGVKYGVVSGLSYTFKLESRDLEQKRYISEYPTF
jgi:hypothetical protein